MTDIVKLSTWAMTEKALLALDRGNARRDHMRDVCARRLGDALRDRGFIAYTEEDDGDNVRLHATVMVVDDPGPFTEAHLQVHEANGLTKAARLVSQMAEEEDGEVCDALWDVAVRLLESADKLRA